MLFVNIEFPIIIFKALLKHNLKYKITSKLTYSSHKVQLLIISSALCHGSNWENLRQAQVNDVKSMNF